MLSSLLKDGPAIAIFFLMSPVTLPSLVTLAPRYVKLSTSSISQFVTLRLAVLFCWPSALCNKLQTGLSWVVSQRCFLVLEMIHSRRQQSNVFVKSMSSSMVVKSHQIPVRSSLTVSHPVYNSYSFSCFYICMVFWLRKLYWKSRGYAIKEYHEIKMFTKTSTRFINTILHTLWFGSLHRFATDKKNVWFVWPYSGFLEHRLAVRN